MNSESFADTADPEIARKLVSRREAVTSGSKSMLGSALALGSIPAALAVLSGEAFAQGGLPGVIVEVLNFALTLEHLESEFYEKGIAARGLLTGNAREQFDQIRKHEAAHVAFLQQALGARAIAKPAFDFTGGGGRGNGPFADVFSNPMTFAALAQGFEDTGVRAYKGQAANLMGNDTILQAALQIHSVEARHAAQVRRIRQQKGWIPGNSRGNMPAQTQSIYNGEGNTFHFILAQPSGQGSMSEAFDETLTRSQVLSIVTPFIASA